MIVVLALLLLVVHNPVQCTLDARWKLAWSDEFTGTSLDQTKWTARTQAGYANNGEQEYYVPSMVSVANGTLILTSTNTSSNGSPYSSGWVDTASKFHTTYGRYEIRAKLPYGKGLWPAHWLLSDYLCWPVGAEVDILEYLGHQTSVAYGTYHFGACCGCNSANGSSITYPADLSQGYHTYAVEWFPDNITWYVDDTAYQKVVNTSLNKGSPFTMDVTPHYIILNTAVGGYWPGNPDATTKFPQYHYIDYVRVYAWQPCTSKCSSHGCCTVSTQICKCDPGHEGANCEYSISSFNTGFNSLDPLYESITNPANAVYSGGLLTMQVNNASCPSGCGGNPYQGAQWGTTLGYSYGNFTARMRATAASGTASIIWGTNTASSFEGFQVYVSGSSTSSVCMQYWVGGASTWVGCYTLGFDASVAQHNYTINYALKTFTLYVDNKQIAKTTNAPASLLSLSVKFDYSTQYWGAFNGVSPIYMYLDAASWNMPPQPPANCTGS